MKEPDLHQYYIPIYENIIDKLNKFITKNQKEFLNDNKIKEFILKVSFVIYRDISTAVTWNKLYHEFDPESGKVQEYKMKLLLIVKRLKTNIFQKNDLALAPMCRNNYT